MSAVRLYEGAGAATGLPVLPGFGLFARLADSTRNEEWYETCSDQAYR